MTMQRIISGGGVATTGGKKRGVGRLSGKAESEERGSGIARVEERKKKEAPPGKGALKNRRMLGSLWP